MPTPNDDSDSNLVMAQPRHLAAQGIAPSSSKDLEHLRWIKVQGEKEAINA